MSVFRYNAYNASGKEVAGSIEARSSKEAMERLKGDGLFPKEITSASGSARRTFSVSSLRRKKKIGPVELASATRQLSTLLSSGATLFDALAILIEEIENKSFTDTLTTVKEDVSAGSTLAGALAAHPLVFPEMYVRMVEAGEESGTLDSVLLRLSELMEVRAAISEQVRTAFMYPIVVTTVCFAVLGFLLVYVIPKITRVFENSEAALPLVTEVLLFVAAALKNFWPVFLIIAFAAYFAYRPLMRKPAFKAAVDRTLLRLPYMGGLLRVYYAASLSRTLGSLLSTGVPILRALDMTAKVLNQNVYNGILAKSEKQVTEGAALSNSLRGTGQIPDLLVHMISIGERSGKLDELLIKAADAYEKDFERSITRALSMLEPALIVFMGGIVGFIVLAILLPIFELNQLIK